MGEFTEVIVDLETTGVHPEHSGIFQLAAIKFNLKTREVCKNTFNIGIHVPQHRYWQEDTRSWWLKKKKLFEEISKLPKYFPKEGLEFFNRWLGKDSYTLWAKPIHFEYPFLESYYRMTGVVSPFHYRNTVDINSFLKGASFPGDVPDVGHNPNNQVLHNALIDCFEDLRKVFHVLDRCDR